jgi:hypothetical protein
MFGNTIARREQPPVQRLFTIMGLNPIFGIPEPGADLAHD